MSLEGNGQPVIYRVSISDNNRVFIKNAYKRFSDKGNGKLFRELLTQAYYRLRNDPLIFGEALWLLPVAQLFVRYALIGQLGLVYGVHEETKTVFIRAMYLLPSP